MKKTVFKVKDQQQRKAETIFFIPPPEEILNVANKDIQAVPNEDNEHHGIKNPILLKMLTRDVIICGPVYLFENDDQRIS